jgi:CrcB protein
MAPSSSSSSSSSSASSLRREVDDLTLVALGAIPGALLRWQLQLLWPAATTPADLAPTDLAAATLAANLLGSLLLGVILGLGQRRPRLMLCGGIGFCGSLTTFSSWMLQLVQVLQQGRTSAALLLLVQSLLGGLLAVAAGLALAGGLQRLRCQHFRRRALRR